VRQYDRIGAARSAAGGRQVVVLAGRLAIQEANSGRGGAGEYSVALSPGAAAARPVSNRRL
jgi:hypothetical protein